MLSQRQEDNGVIYSWSARLHAIPGPCTLSTTPLLPLTSADHLDTTATAPGRARQHQRREVRLSSSSGKRKEKTTTTMFQGSKLCLPMTLPAHMPARPPAPLPALLAVDGQSFPRRSLGHRVQQRRWRLLK